MAVDYNHPNMALWKAAEPTDPAFVKAITGKQYKGTSPSPQWVKLRLTEAFGPQGIGWGTKVLSERFETIGPKVMHYLRIEFWFVHEGKRGTIEEFGGTECGGVRKSSGEAYADEDAPKKSMTDALVKAASGLGFCADIFLGRWDDSKYVAEREDDEKVQRQKQAQQNQAAAAAEQAQLVQRVSAMCDQLASITVEEAFAAARAEAMDLRTRLNAHGMKADVTRLGEAVKATAARLAPAARQAA